MSEGKPSYTRKYTMEWYVNEWLHTWEIVGHGFGVHLHIHPYEVNGEPVRYSAGLEMHYAAPPDHMKHKPPSHVPCWLIKVPCWHDGTSMYAQEHFVPLFLRMDHDAIFYAMGEWARERI